MASFAKPEEEMATPMWRRRLGVEGRADLLERPVGLRVREFRDGGGALGGVAAREPLLDRGRNGRELVERSDAPVRGGRRRRGLAGLRDVRRDAPLGSAGRYLFFDRLGGDVFDGAPPFPGRRGFGGGFGGGGPPRPPGGGAGA